MQFPITKKIFAYLKTKTATSIFAIAAFIGGLAFINKNPTGNAILNYTQPYNYLSLIGLALIICAITLAVYTVKK